MNAIKELKQKQKEVLNSAADARAMAVMTMASYTELEQSIVHMSEEPYSNYDSLYLDDGGYLNARSKLDIGDIAEEESEVIELIFETLTDAFGGWIHFDQTSQEYVFDVCLGAPIILNANPDRGYYAVYSQELGLELSKEDLFTPNNEHCDYDCEIGERYAWLLIEKKKREVGVFENVVSLDYYGNPTLLETPKDIVAMTDKALDEAINTMEKESEEEND